MLDHPVSEEIEAVSEQPVTIELSFISLKESSHLKIHSKAAIWGELLLLFSHTFYPERNYYELETIQQNTPIFRERLAAFVDRLKAKLPKAQAFSAFFRRMPDGHYFVIVTGLLADTLEIMGYFKYLSDYHQSKGIPVKDGLSNLKFGELLKQYNVNFFGHQRRVIGSGSRSERHCRFCGCAAAETNSFGERVTFNGKAHAISQALGNTLVSVLEECDSCNGRFSRTIEPSMIAILEFFRSLHDLKGKDGSKVITGENFTIRQNEGMFDIHLDEILDLSNGPDLRFRLHSRGIFVPQDFYRCLVKFVLSVINSLELPAFEKTLQWVNGAFDARSLPKIAYLQHAAFFTPQPMLMVFTRKGESRHPYLVGEFHYADHIYAFVIPFCSKDRYTFTQKKHYEPFWSMFNMVREHFNWEHTSYASSRKIKVACDFTIVNGQAYLSN